MGHSFYFSDFMREIVNALEEDEKTEMQLAIAKYCLNGISPSFTGVMNVTWLNILHDLHSTSGHFDKRKITSAENGKKGGRPRKQKIQNTNVE